jgi:hypothetical protein
LFFFLFAHSSFFLFLANLIVHPFSSFHVKERAVSSSKICYSSWNRKKNCVIQNSCIKLSWNNAIPISHSSSHHLVSRSRMCKNCVEYKVTTEHVPRREASCGFLVREYLDNEMFFNEHSITMTRITFEFFRLELLQVSLELFSFLIHSSVGANSCPGTLL